jgi:DNA-binding transcriptional ArsR family regulator
MPAARRVRLDSRRLRTLAHPLRSRLLSALRLDGPATSATLAARLDTNTGATSYHLRQLAEVGLIEEVGDRGTGRERWWRAAHDVTSWSDADFDRDPDDRAAADWLLGHHVRTKARWVEDWLATRTQWPEAWRRAASLGDMRLRLTAAQAAALEAELYGVVQRFRDAGPAAGAQDANDAGDVGDADVADVLVLIDLFPIERARL